MAVATLSNNWLQNIQYICQAKNANINTILGLRLRDKRRVYRFLFPRYGSLHYAIHLVFIFRFFVNFLII